MDAPNSELALFAAVSQAQLLVATKGTQTVNNAKRTQPKLVLSLELYQARGRIKP